MGGISLNSTSQSKKNITKRSFIVFINAINNVFLNWMENSDCPDDFKVKS